MLLAGCATSPHETAPSVWTDTNSVLPLPVYPPVPPPANVVKTNLVVIVRTNAPPANPPTPKVVPRPPILTWTSLNRWALQNKIAAPRRLTGGPTVRYAISSPAGTLILEIGSREATWRNIQINLGFAPEIVDDQVFVHGLDLQKNLEPLLLGESLTLGANRVVVLDPGHGGIKAGTVSVLDGRPEKEFTLDLARRLKPLLATNGWTVYLTRTNDADIALSNRVSFAEAHHAALFISLHFNSNAPDKKQSGLETYCQTPTGMPSTLTRGYTDFWTDHFPNNNFDVENLLLALRLHAAVLHASGEEDRGIRRARFMDVLHGQNRPAVLIECGYLSNPHEAEKIENPEFRQQLAEAIANALK